MRKVYLLLLAILLIVQAFGQRMNREEMMHKIDSLIHVNQNLSATLDSVNKEKELYLGMYEVVREKVVKDDFNPEEMADIIDSMEINANSNTSSLIASNTSLKDSLAILKISFNRLQQNQDSLLNTTERKEAIQTQEEVIKAKAIGNLKQLKQLYDSGILNDEEFLLLKKKYLEKL
jgi:hypothetical protein